MPGNSTALSRESPVLKSLIEDGRFLTPERHVRIKNIDPQTFLLACCFIYIGALPTSGINLISLVALMLAARSLRMPNLWVQCEDRICTLVSTDNVLKLMEQCYYFESEKITLKLIEFFCENAEHLFVDKNFLHLSSSILTQIVQQDKINIVTELQVIEAYVEWTKNYCKVLGKPVNDDNIRITLVDNFMQHFRFLSLSPQEFVKGLAKCGWLTDKEKVSIFSRIVVPKDYDQSPVLCGSTITKKRSSIPMMFLGISIPKGIMSHNEKNTIYKNAIIFNADLILHGITCYAQIFNPDQLFKNDISFELGNSYEEEMVLIVSEKDIVNFNLEDNGDSFSDSLMQMKFQKLSTYTSLIKFDFFFKIKKNEVVFIYLICKTKGFYPMCAELDSIQLNHLKISPHQPSDDFNIPSPLTALSIYCPRDKPSNNIEVPQA